MLGGHEDKSLLLCSNTIGPFWRNRSESGFWGTSIRSPSHKCINPGDHLSATQVSVFGGSSQNLQPYFDF